MTPFVPRRPPLWTISSMAESQQAHAVVTRASRRSIKGIARASQMHDAHQERLADCTWRRWAQPRRERREELPACFAGAPECADPRDAAERSARSFGNATAPR